MATHHELGKRGEEIARKYLEEKGYLILETNWRFRHTEIDLIAFHQGILVFAEVKSRSPGGYGYPEDSVNHRKQHALQRASSAYISQKKFEDEIRFDIISITFNAEQSYELFHIEDAFFPGL
ncbi:MAG TPA: YraN family protein [Anseongella sp.]